MSGEKLERGAILTVNVGRTNGRAGERESSIVNAGERYTYKEIRMRSSGERKFL